MVAGGWPVRERLQCSAGVCACVRVSVPDTAMTPCWLLVLLCSSPLWQTEGVEGWGISTVPSESECRPYIEKALKEHSPETPQEAVDATGSEHETPPSPSIDQEGSIEETEEATTKESVEGETGDEGQTQTERESAETAEESTEEVPKSETETTSGEEVVSTEETAASTEATESQEDAPEESIGEDDKGEKSSETEEVKEETTDDQQVSEGGEESAETNENVETTSAEDAEELGGEQSAEIPDEGKIEDKTEDEEAESIEQTEESTVKEGESLTDTEEQQEETNEEEETGEEVSTEQTLEETTESEEGTETTDDTVSSIEEHAASEEEAKNTGAEVTDSLEASESAETQEEEAVESAEAGAGEVVTESIEETAENVEASTEEAAPASVEETAEDASPASAEEPSEDTTENTEEGSAEETKESVEDSETDSLVEPLAEDTVEASGETETSVAEEQPVEETPVEEAPVEETPVEDEVANETIKATPTSEGVTESEQQTTEQTEEQEQPADEGEAVKEAAATVEDQLSLEFEVPKVRRQREHIGEILKLTPESAEVEMLLAKTIESTLKELKKLYDSAIKPLEILYKYRDLSNRHFGDPEIFSKPLILFMGPWSGGKSSIINYLLDNEFQASSLRTGAEPSPAYFNILMWGEREEVLDGTQLAADWTFSGLQKFGQGLLDRLRGLKLNNPILEKVNIVEIPGILEIRKQVERLFPFNDACQWFIDRADIIFLVYDPSKLDVGPETEAILDQLKGREYQTRILLNKADQVKPEELMRVQGTLIWNISPLMSSQEPPILYSTSLWSVPYEQGAPTRLLHAQERAFLRDLRAAVDKRVENKIASARRFAVRVRNHAKMVDCYLTTYYNHKTFFGNRKKVADDIIEHPQNYHIYEGLSTLTNISRYDLPDPEVYRDFFRLNPVYDFQRLSDTCTYFRGCPINRLDVAIAYDLPELVGKYKKQAERVLEAAAAQASKS